MEHRASITEREAFAELVRAVWGYTGTPETAACLKLMCLLYPRPGELRLATWPEFDLDKAIWTIPAARTKMRREQKKPLSALAIEILRNQKNLSRNYAYVFPSIRTWKRPCRSALRPAPELEDALTSVGGGKACLA